MELTEGTIESGGTLFAPPATGVNARFPLLCGALGHYSRSRAVEIADALHPSMAVRWEDAAGILFCDREPRSWGDPIGRSPGGRGGLALPTQLAPAATPRGWRDAARSWNAPGLAHERDGVRVHTSISGLSPVYVQREPEATYFSSRIDALARTSPRYLTVDWEAWSSIFALTYLLADRTPFREIRRLPAWTALRHERGSASVVERETSPWHEIEPNGDPQATAEAVHEALSASFERIADKPLTVPLSAGRDSRLLLAYAQRAGADVDAVTVYEDNGTDRELEIGGAVCERLGVPHRRRWPQPAEFWEDSRIRNLSADFSQATSPWMIPPLMRALSDGERVALDGIASNVLFERTVRESATRHAPSGDRRWIRALWRLQRRPSSRAALRRELSNGIQARARENFFSTADHFASHPTPATIFSLTTKTERRLTLRPASSLGSVSEVAAPMLEDSFATPVLQLGQEHKNDYELYKRVFELAAPEMLEIPFSSMGAADLHADFPRRRTSYMVLQGYRDVLSAGPLRPYLSNHLREWLRGDDYLPAQRPGMFAGLEAVATFHMWWERYADKLEPFDIADAFDIRAREP